MARTLFKSRLTINLGRASARAGFWLLVAFCYVMAGATGACVKLPRRAGADQSPQASPTSATQPAQGAVGVNINTASPAELARLPGIGPALAARIVAHRKRYGPFRRAEQLLLVRGISEARFAQLRPHITTE